MYIEIQARGFELSKHLEEHIYTKLTNTMRSANNKVRKIIVRLFNEDARHNRRIRNCRIHISVKGLPDIVTNHRSSNIYAASNAAIKTSSLTVRTKLKKLKNLKRSLTKENS